MGCVLTTFDELSIEQHLALDASRLALAASGIRCCGVELLAVDAPLSACRRWASTGAAELVPAAYGIRCRRVVHAATIGIRSSAVGRQQLALDAAASALLVGLRLHLMHCGSKHSWVLCCGVASEPPVLRGLGASWQRGLGA